MDRSLSDQGLVNWAGLQIVQFNIPPGSAYVWATTLFTLYIYLHWQDLSYLYREF